LPTSPRSRARTAVDAFLDLVLADNVDCELTMASWNTREDRMRELLNNKAILMALGDGGAHVDMLCDAGYPTYLLGTWVRGEAGDHPGRGRAQADVRSRRSLRSQGPRPAGQGRARRRGDLRSHAHRLEEPWRAPLRLPGGAKRIVMPSNGVEYTVVNGAVTWEQGKLTAAKAGKVLRG